MKRIILLAFIFVFAIGVVVVSAEGDGCDKAAKKASAAAGAKSCCAAKAKTASVEKLSDKDVKKSFSCSGTSSHAAKNLSGEKSHACPDVSSNAALEGFHESMHPMHVALGEKDFDTIREKLPNLITASKSVADYKCASYDKCSDASRKTCDSMKTDLIDSVEQLKLACKGGDNELVAVSFDGMHEAYITFANTCSSH